MSRRMLAGVVLVLALLVGVVIGPVVFSRVGTADGGATASPTSTSASATSPAPSTAATPTTEEPRTPSPTTPSLSPRDEADRLAGVRSREIPQAGSGELRTVPGEDSAPEGDAPVTTVRVEVEEGLDIDDAAFASFVMETLNDPRGWGADGSVRFARTDGEADIRVVLATPSTVDAMCAPLATNGRWSCGRNGHAALNADRWALGADAWLDGDGSVTGYRRYLLNHEVGHLLGHPHEQCPVRGEPAPVMVQQSISLSGCAPNPWPFP